MAGAKAFTHEQKHRRQSFYACAFHSICVPADATWKDLTMKHIIALHREVSMSTSASMFGPAVAMAAEAIERAPDIMMRLRRLQFAERLLQENSSGFVQ